MLRRLTLGVRRFSIRLTRFRLSTVLWLMALAAILMAWRRDHQHLLAEIERIQYPSQQWGADEATGPPNTQGYGDIGTAWASKTQDDQEEWLLLEFNAVEPTAIHIYETHNPGAVVKISRVTMWGEQVLWEGVDPTPPSRAGGVSKFPLLSVGKTSQIAIYLDSPKFGGWNEIDAVALIDAAGNPHWALRAAASSSYGPRGSLNDPW